jgi:hypothetical protein
MGCLEGKLSWRRAGERGREPRLGLGREIFNLEPVADRRRQKQKDKEDGQSQRDLVEAMTCAGCDGNRQYKQQSDQGQDRQRPYGSNRQELLFRSAHRL